MTETKDFRKKSIDFVDFTSPGTATARLAYSRIGFYFIRQVRRDAFNDATLSGPGLASKSAKGVFVSVIKMKLDKSATNSVRMGVAATDKLTSFRSLNLKRYQTLAH
jgi:hypothetical protein